MNCRPGCGGCCISISISSPMPGLPGGKPAGMRCPHLDSLNLCRLWGTVDYPDVCRNFRADPIYCGETREQALWRLAELERLTRPDPPAQNL